MRLAAADAPLAPAAMLGWMGGLGVGLRGAPWDNARAVGREDVEAARRAGLVGERGTTGTTIKCGTTTGRPSPRAGGASSVRSRPEGEGAHHPLIFSFRARDHARTRQTPADHPADEALSAIAGNTAERLKSARNLRGHGGHAQEPGPIAPLPAAARLRPQHCNYE
jgi:hypothetical protein